MEMASASQALCEGNPPVTDGFPTHRLPVTQDFDVLFDVSWTKNRVAGDSDTMALTWPHFDESVT